MGSVEGATASLPGSGGLQVAGPWPLLVQLQTSSRPAVVRELRTPGVDHFQFQVALVGHESVENLGLLFMEFSFDLTSLFIMVHNIQTKAIENEKETAGGGPGFWACCSQTWVSQLEATG